MAAEIWSTSDRTFCYFDHFVSFSPFFCLNNSDNQNFEKMKEKKKKKPGDIIILHMCTINDNHMMNGSLDMECNEHNFL